MDRKIEALRELFEVVVKLRGPGGCPWDREQTLLDVTRYIVEEACEVADAVHESSGRPSAEVREELGDLLMTLFLATCIAEEDQEFSVEDVAENTRKKLIRRHPHVFGDEVAHDADDVLRRWNEIKKEEKAAAADDGTGPNGPRSRLEGVPRSLPPLARALRITERAAGCGFDWPDAAGAIKKLEEELGELQAVLESGTDGADDATAARVEDELGDILFSAVNVCRKLGVNPDVALRSTIRKFTRRFETIEARLGNLDEASLEEMDKVWDEERRRLPSFKAMPEETPRPGRPPRPATRNHATAADSERGTQEETL